MRSYCGHVVGKRGCDSANQIVATRSSLVSVSLAGVRTNQHARKISESEFQPQTYLHSAGCPVIAIVRISADAGDDAEARGIQIIDRRVEK